jgi:cation:H+ antiporter
MILIAGLITTFLIIVRIGITRGAGDALESEFTMEIPRDLTTTWASMLLITGLIILLLSSKMLVYGVTQIAQTIGISDLVIGLTVVAIGTSLPELAASVASAFKNEPDIAIGNIVGSNLYNLLAVLCLPGLIAPGPVAPELLGRDMLVMVGLTIALFAMGWRRFTSGKITRREGVFLLAAFIGYQYWVYLDSYSSIV